MSENTTTTTTVESDKPRRPIALWKLIAAMLLAAVVTFAITALLMNIFQRKQEGKNPYVRLVDVDAAGDVWSGGRCRTVVRGTLDWA